MPHFITSYEVQKVGNKLTGNGLALVSQAEFARMKGVSRKTATQWKSEKRLVFAGKLIDVAASQAELLRQASHASAGKRAPVTQAAEKVTGYSVSAGMGNAARYANGVTYGNPANLPDEVTDTSAHIASGAIDMARLLRPHMPMPLVKALVTAWVRAMRAGYVGGPGMLAAVADEEWPPPPIGLSHWCEHPYFVGDPLHPSELDEIEEDFAAGTLPRVTA